MESHQSFEGIPSAARKPKEVNARQISEHASKLPPTFGKLADGPAGVYGNSEANEGPLCT